MVSEIGSRPEEGLGGDEDWPPGFRFHPTDEELVLYYLKRKICGKKLKLNIIAVIDVYKCDPEELPGLALLKSGDRQWFFFTPRDRKYPNGARSNRATSQGYWKATGKDRCITCNSRSVGLKKTLVFYRGRAPSGERTDWVMHEYTLDEEELKRCQNIEEYYALYKIYKKSGPGPKNGEQYGAPFREEDWNYDCPDFNKSANRDISVEKDDETLPNGVAKVDCKASSFPDNIDELLKNLTEDSLPDLPSIDDFTHTPFQVRNQETVQSSTMVDLHSNQEPSNVLYANSVQRNLQISFDLTQSTESQLHSNEAPKVASATPNYNELEAYMLAEEDFLEMDDLLGPEPVVDNINVEEALNDILVEEDGLCELDLYHDAAMFLNDLGQSNVINPHEYCLSHDQLGTGDADQLYVQVSGEVVNQPYLGFDAITQHYSNNNANQVNNQLFLDEVSPPYAQEGSVITSAEFYDDNYPDPTSVYGSSNNSLPADKNQSGDEENGAPSWLSSAVWSFVESIPTTPASAAENALVNRAFERMSSFSRLRMNSIGANVPSGSDSETTKTSSKKIGFIFIPVVVAVIAVSWVVLR